MAKIESCVDCSYALEYGFCEQTNSDICEFTRDKAGFPKDCPLSECDKEKMYKIIAAAHGQSYNGWLDNLAKMKGMTEKQKSEIKKIKDNYNQS